MDAGFERVDRDIRELRGEMNAGFDALRSLVYRVGGGIMASVVVVTTFFSNL